MKPISLTRSTSAKQHQQWGQ